MTSHGCFSIFSNSSIKLELVYTFQTPSKQNLENKYIKVFSQPFHQRERKVCVRVVCVCVYGCLRACMCLSMSLGLLSKFLATLIVYKVLIRTLSLFRVPEIGLKFLPSIEHIPEVVK